MTQVGILQKPSFVHFMFSLNPLVLHSYYMYYAVMFNIFCRCRKQRVFFNFLMISGYQKQTTVSSITNNNW